MTTIQNPAQNLSLNTSLGGGEFSAQPAANGDIFADLLQILPGMAEGEFPSAGLLPANQPGITNPSLNNLVHEQLLPHEFVALQSEFTSDALPLPLNPEMPMVTPVLSEQPLYPVSAQQPADLLSDALPPALPIAEISPELVDASVDTKIVNDAIDEAEIQIASNEASLDVMAIAAAVPLLVDDQAAIAQPIEGSEPEIVALIAARPVTKDADKVAAAAQPQSQPLANAQTASDNATNMASDDEIISKEFDADLRREVMAEKKAAANQRRNAQADIGERVDIPHIAQPSAPKSIIHAIQQLVDKSAPIVMPAQHSAGQESFDHSSGQHMPELFDGDGQWVGTKAIDSAAPSFKAVLQMAKNLPNYVPPTQQVAVQLQRAVADGVNQINIQLTPEELGKIEVKLKFDADGRVSGTILADKFETLDLLQRDRNQLEKVLQDAGIKTDSNSLSFNLRGEQGQQQGEQSGSAAGRNTNSVADHSDDAELVQIMTRHIISRDAVDIQV